MPLLNVEEIEAQAAQKNLDEAKEHVVIKLAKLKKQVHYYTDMYKTFIDELEGATSSSEIYAACDKVNFH